MGCFQFTVLSKAVADRLDPGLLDPPLKIKANLCQPERQAGEALSAFQYVTILLTFTL
jgi:hypothetical protein